MAKFSFRTRQDYPPGQERIIALLEIHFTWNDNKSQVPNNEFEKHGEWNKRRSFDNKRIIEDEIRKFHRSFQDIYICFQT